MAIVSQGTILEIAGSSAGAKNVSVVAVGYPTIITFAAPHGLKNGDVVTLSDFDGADKDLLNGKTAVLKYVTTSTVAVDFDTTLKTIADGKVTPKAWTKIGEVTDINRAGGTKNKIDATHLESKKKAYLFGLPDEGDFTFSFNWDFDDPGQDAILEAEGSSGKYTFRVTYSDNSTLTFDGEVISVSGPNLGVDDKLVGDVTISMENLQWA